MPLVLLASARDLPFCYGLNMAEKSSIISLIKEAEVYRAQGLSAESRKTYRQALRLIKNDAQLAQNDELIESVQEKNSCRGTGDSGNRPDCGFS